LCHSICTSGRDRNEKNLAIPLYALFVLPPITHSDAPPMIAFCGAPGTSSQYGMLVTAHSNLAPRRTLACPPVLSVIIAHSPLVNLAPAWLVRPA
jgi:hypothetical protein